MGGTKCHSAILISVLLVGIVTSYYVICSVILLAYLLFYFFKNLGKKILLLEIVAILAMVQWVVTPIILNFFFEKNDLTILELNNYLPFAFTGASLFIIGFSIPLFYTSQQDHRLLINGLQNYINDKEDLAFLLMLIGLFASLLRPMMPLAFSHLFSLLSYFIYIGLLYSIFVGSKKRLYIFFIVAIYTFVSIAREGMFNILVYWGMFFVIFYSFTRKINLVKKIFTFFIGITLILLIQSIKFDYRESTWSKGGKQPNFSLLNRLVQDRIAQPDILFREDSYIALFGRLNQGLFIAQTMKHVPKHEPFANGETIREAILGALLPRLIWDDKPIAGGTELFPRFTGWELPKGTSMNISAMGEAYVNFGYYGAFIFLFCFGLLFNFVFSYCLKVNEVFPSILLWLPFLFKNSIFVGTDVFTILNGLTTASFFLFVFYWFCKLFFKIRI